MRQVRCFITQFGFRFFGELLAKLHAPLVETVDIPDRALHEHAVLIQRNQCAKRMRSQAIGEDGGTGAVAFKHPVRHQGFIGALGAHGVGILAKRQRFALCKQVGHEQIVLLFHS